MGAELPTILPNQDEAPFEAIAAARPDMIMAAYSGITAEEYELLSAIAPVVAYPGEAWATPWQELIEIVGTSLARKSVVEGKRVSVRVDIGGRRIIKKKSKNKQAANDRSKTRCDRNQSK